MDCHTCRKKLSDFHEGEVEAAEAEEIRSHLDACPECAREYERLSAVVSAVRNLDTIEPPADMLDRIKSALDREDARRSEPSILGRIGPILAAAACVVLVVGIALQQGGLLSGLSSQTPTPTAETATMDRVMTADEAAPSGSAVETDLPEAAETERAEAEETAPAPDAEEIPSTAPETPETQRAPPPAPSREMAVTATEETAEMDATRDAELAAGSAGSDATAEEGPQPPPPAVADATSGGPAGPRRAFGGARGGASEAAYMEGTAHDRLEPRPLMKSARTAPSVRKLQARFIPPRTRQVGRAVTCAVEIESATDLPRLGIRVETRQGLQLRDASDGYIYRGPIHAGEMKTIEFRIRPLTPGTHRVRITLETPDEKLKSQMEATLPGFVHRRGEQSLDPLGEPVSVDFRETPVRHALLEVAREGQINLVLDSSETGPRVTYSCKDTPAGAVVRILAEDAGYSVDFQHDTYFVGIGD